MTTTPAAEEARETLPEVTIEQLSEPLRAAVARAKWTTLMPVQARAIPYLLAKRDMMIQARTGSGKTGAYLLPMLERLDPSLKDYPLKGTIETRKAKLKAFIQILTTVAPAEKPQPEPKPKPEAKPEPEK